MQPSFTEKSVWIQLVSMLVALGAYSVVAGVMLSEGVDQLAAFVPLFVVSVVFLVVLQISGHTVAAITARPESPDERDRLIRWRSESNSSWIVAIGVLGGITALVVAVDPVWIAHCLLLSLFVSQVAAYVFQLVYYRRGMQGVGGV